MKLPTPQEIANNTTPTVENKGLGPMLLSGTREIRTLTDPFEQELGRYRLFEIITQDHQVPAPEARRLIEAACLSAPLREGGQRTDFTAPTVKELLATLGANPGPTWLLPGYLAKGNLTILAGHAKTGKTTFTTNAAVHIASGVPFLDRHITQTPVLWLDLEQHPDHTLGMFQPWGEDAEGIRVHSATGFRNSPAQLAAFIREHGIGLLIVDSLAKFWKGTVEKEEDAVQVERGMAPLLEIARDTGVSILAIHHRKKNTEGSADGLDVRGSGAIIANADIVVSFQRPKGQRDSDQRLLESISRYHDTPRAYMVEYRNGIYVSLGPEAAVAKNDMQRRALAAVLAQAEDVTAEDVADSLGMPKSTSALRTALKELHEQGKVNRTGKGIAGMPFRYSRNVCPPDSPGIGQTDIQTAA